MFNWLKELFEIRREYGRQDVCDSCETLKKQLEIRNFEYKQLLDTVLAKPEVPIIEHKPAQIIQPKTIPWRVRQQMLESEDRARANAMKNVATPDVVKTEPKNDIEKLEDELGVKDAI